MNKIYRTVWNKATGQMVAASELAKSRTGQGGSEITDVAAQPGFGMQLLTRWLVALGLVAASVPALAQSYEAPGSAANATGGQSIAIGDSVPADAPTASGQGATAIGILALAGGNHSIAFGTNAVALGGIDPLTGQLRAGNIALGHNAVANNTDTISIGTLAGSNSSLAGAASVNIGLRAGQDGGGRYTIAIGSGAGVGILGDGNTALGHNAGNAVELGLSTLAVNRTTSIGELAIGSGVNATAVGAVARASGGYSIAIGGNGTNDAVADATTAIGVGSTAIGAHAKTEGVNSIAMGTSAHTGTSGSDAIALGSGAKATAANAISIGPGTTASGTSSISIGTGNTVTGARSGAIGDPTFINADDSYAIGNNNTIAAGANKSFVLGNNVSVTNSNNVVLGNDAADKALATVTPTAVGNATTPASYAGTPTGVVSVGAASKERQIVNVAPGAISATSTDAINGSQLFHTNQAVNAVTTTVNTITSGGGIKYFHAGSTLADSSATGTDSVAMGPVASATATNAIAVGKNAVAGTANSVALGSDAVTAATTATTGATIGGTAYTFAGTAPTGTVSVGATGTERTLTNLAAGRLSGTSTDAVNGSQLFATNTAVNSLATTVNGGTRYFHASDTGLAVADSYAIGQGSVAAGWKAGEAGAASNLFNTAVGHTSGQNVTGQQNVALGWSAGSNVTNPANAGPGPAPTGAVNNVGIGTQAGNTVVGDRNVGIGTTAGMTVTGSKNTSVGDNTGASVTGGANSAFGANAGRSVIGDANVAMGSAAGSNVGTGTVASNRNIAIGSSAGNTVTGNNNTAIGESTGSKITNGSGNVSIGLNSGNVLGSGSNRNIAIGSGSVNGAGNNVTGSDNVALGSGTGLSISASNTVAIGSAAKASSNSAIAMGTSATASALTATAIGSSAAASGQDSLAIGTGAKAVGANSISIGTGNTVNGARSGAIGDPTLINADDSYAIGNNNTIAAGANKSFVLGNNVSVTNSNNVILGNDAADKAFATVTPVAVGSVATPASYAGTATGVVSVGAASKERQIVNVAPGAINATSTDAINGSQLFHTNSAINTITNGGGIKYFHAGSTLADSSATGTDSVAVGPVASATATNAVAIGNGATAGTANSVALGNGAVTAAAVPTSSTVLQGTTYNFAGTAPTGVLSVGTAGAERQVTNVAAGRLSATSTDAVNGSQLFATNTALNALTTTVSSSGKYFHANSTLPDSSAVGANSIAVGPNAVSTGTNTISMGNGAGATSTATNGVYIGSAAQLTGYTVTDKTGAVVAVNTTGTVGTASSDGTTPGFTEGQVAVGTATGNRVVGGANTAVGFATGNDVTGTRNAAFGTLAGSNVTGDRDTAVGHYAGSKVTGSFNTAVGDYAGSETAGSQNSALGTSAGYAQTGSRNTSVGNNAGNRVIGSGNSAIGDNALSQAQGSDNVGIGTYAGAGVSASRSVAIGGYRDLDASGTLTAGDVWTTASTDSVAVGTGARATGATSVAMGLAATAGATNAVAIGNGATAGTARSVALGDGAATAAPVGTASAVIQGTTYNFAGTAPVGTVSVGTVGAERTVTNVAAGRISATSTDAINGSQLFATNTAVNTLVSGGAGPVQYSNTGTPTTPNGGTATNDVTLVGANTTAPVALHNVAPGAVTSTSTDAVNGSQLNTLGTSIANNFGGGSTFDPTTGTVTAPSYTVLGSTYNNVGDAITNIGGTINNIAGDTSATYVAANGTGIKYVRTNDTGLTADDAHATVPGATAVGYNATASHAQSAAIGRDALADGSTLATAAYNPGTATLAGTTPVGELSVGKAGSERRITNVAAGATDTDAVNVSQLKAVTTSVTNSGVQYDDPNTKTTVTLGGTGATAPVTVTNLAPGALSPTSTDAVNGSQLDATNQNVTNLGNTLSNIAGDTSTTYVAANGTGIKYVRTNDTGLTADDAHATVPGATAVGYNATASHAQSAAIGRDALADGSTLATAAYNPGTGTVAGATPVGELSVGKAGSERRITNVAAGATDTDAVNVSQLKAVDSRITTVMNGGAGPVQYSNTGTPTTPNGGTPTNDVTLVGANTGAPVAVHNVAPGTTTAGSTDAVNGGQINTLATSIATNLGGGSTYDPATGTVTAPSYTVQGNTYNNVGSALGGLDTGLTNVTNTVNSINNGAGIKYFHANSTLPDSSATGTNSVAVGPNAVASQTDSVAMGNGANASTPNSVALGAGATTAAAVAVPNAVIAGTSYTFAGGAPVGVVSVGAPGSERQITNVAAGRLAADSTDAVNGSQLFATNQAVSTLSTQVINGAAGPVQYSTAGTPTTPNGGTITNHVTLVGADTNAPVGLHNVAAGSTTAGSTDAVNGGQINTLASSIATNLGGGSTYDPATGTVTAPSYTIGGTTYNNVGSALGAVDSSLGTLNTTVNNINSGAGIKYFHANSTLPDSTASGTNSVAAGPAAVASGANTVAVGNGATASADNSVALGAGSVADRTNTVSVGAAGAERQITNVAAGTRGTDAVNVNQLNGVAAGGVRYDTNVDGSPNYNSLTLGNGSSSGPVAIHNVAPGVAGTDAVNVNQLNSGIAAANAYTDSRVNQLNNSLNDVAKKAYAGVAGAMAMENAPYVPGKVTYAAGLGYYQRQAAVGVSLRKTADNGRWSVGGGISASSGGIGVRVGVSGVWD